jgi:fido (protein-threonine AMPylation protein)
MTAPQSMRHTAHKAHGARCDGAQHNSQSERKSGHNAKGEREADSVSLGIAEVLDVMGFDMSPEFLQEIHGRPFAQVPELEGYAGRFRDYDSVLL